MTKTKLRIRFSHKSFGVCDQSGFPQSYSPVSTFNNNKNDHSIKNGDNLMSVITCSYPHKMFKFPCGEMHVQYEKTECIDCDEVDIYFNFENMDDIFELLLCANALKHQEIKINILDISYVPFGRQDRINNEGECFSLEVFADLINSIGAKKVIVIDPHSDVTTALIKNCVVIQQHEVFKHYFFGKDNFYLVSPDGGALKKIYKLAKEVDCLGVIECSKKRNTKTGEITGVEVHLPVSLINEDCYIVDDICDGGRTFIEIAKEIKKCSTFTGKIILMITHGFFTKGLEVFDNLIDEIYTLKGRIK